MSRSRIAIIGMLAVAALLSAVPILGSATVLFTATGSARAVNGKSHDFRIIIRKWDLDAVVEEDQSISFPTFTVINICSGRVETTIAGETVVHNPDEYWAMKAGSTMRLRVLSESAVLQTLAITP
jgi:hypothetical protein